MFAIAARRMGYRVHTLSPDYDTPTGQIADVEVVAAYDDLDAVREFAAGVDVVTFEFENVPSETARLVNEHVPVRPAGSVLEVTQNRLREKRFLESHGFPVTPFIAVRSESELSAAINVMNGPGILKTSEWGYDGKGQTSVDATADAGRYWQELGTDEAVLEKRVDFECEVSVVVGRALSGAICNFEVTRNDHHNKILDLSRAPAGLDDRTRRRAVEIGRATAEELGLVGVLCTEMFVTTAGEILVNELAPRPHNSGHWTFDACVTSQFEQQLRAICGLPLGSTEQLRPVAMANLLGELWAEGEPDWNSALRHPSVKLHLYGKSQPRPGRKMGHLTALSDTSHDALRRVTAARQALQRS